jgi:hypothetical protein
MQIALNKPTLYRQLLCNYMYFMGFYKPQIVADAG